MTLNDLEPPKYGVLVNFSRFQAEIHILRSNCTEMVQDRPGNLHMKCSALNVNFNGVRFDPLGSRSPPYECIKFGYPRQNARFLLLSTNLARERLQGDTDLLRIITSTADDLSGVPTSMTLNDLEPKKYGFLVNCSLF